MKLEEFLKKSLTSFHTTENCEIILKEYGFQRLFFSDNWNLEKGGKYYIVKNQSSIIAFTIGNLNNYFFNIAEAHTDSPSLKVKGNKLIPSLVGSRVNVEKYGSINYYSLFDIPMKIAGRVFCKENEKIISKLVESKNNVNIPSLAIHQNRDMNEGVKFTVQNDLLPLAGNVEDIYSFLNIKNVIDADLFVVPDLSPFRSGFKNEYLCSPRLDNLISVWCIIQGICNCNSSGISIACCFDNEEIGSMTKQGANSSFLTSVLQMINNSLSFSNSKFIQACNKGLILSIDNAHAIHPAHPEKSDIVEQVKLGKGIVIKHNINYSTDAYSSSKIKVMLEENNIEYQDFYCNSDIRCGSTLGLFTSSLLQMNSCDIGIAQLAMHSTIETVAYKDVETMEKCCISFFEYQFNCNN